MGMSITVAGCAPPPAAALCESYRSCCRAAARAEPTSNSHTFSAYLGLQTSSAKGSLQKFADGIMPPPPPSSSLSSPSSVLLLLLLLLLLIRS